MPERTSAARSIRGDDAARNPHGLPLPSHLALAITAPATARPPIIAASVPGHVWAIILVGSTWKTLAVISTLWNRGQLGTQMCLNQ
ncbi:hypothetical protein D1872_312070 [compost metagenome]